MCVCEGCWLFLVRWRRRLGQRKISISTFGFFRSPFHFDIGQREDEKTFRERTENASTTFTWPKSKIMKVVSCELSERESDWWRHRERDGNLSSFLYIFLSRFLSIGCNVVYDGCWPRRSTKANYGLFYARRGRICIRSKEVLDCVANWCF